LEAALSACLQHLKNYRQIPVIRVSMNSDAFYGRSGEQWQKLGIGSSAAVTVALMGALVSEFKLQLSPAELATVCHQAHRIFQEGRGSGIDVVTALHGGVVSAQSTTDAEELVVAERQWPEGLSILPVWTGVGASTTELLSRVSAFRDNNPGDYGRHMLQLVDLSMEADRVWQAGDAADVKTALGACDQALQAFDHDASVGIYTEPHHRIRALVEGKGAAYKVSGAGGGDFGLAITESTDVADLLRAACAEKGIMILERPFAAAGLIVSE
ncbi:MAG: hypothetical protein OEU86_08900, partial [Gammaproteobacteria bacterium]|nr:hypothetical protein [Gammaproteobacteria bacterium]